MTLNVKTTLLIGALSAAMLATAVQAHGPRGGEGPGARPAFEELDANSDGQLTPDELEAFRAARFTEADTDGDGALSPEEMLARAEVQAGERRAARIERMIARLDTNDDGKLSLEEMPAGGNGRGDMFSRLDADEDGAISAEEFAAAGDRFGGGRRGQGTGDGHGQGHGWGHGRSN